MQILTPTFFRVIVSMSFISVLRDNDRSYATHTDSNRFYCEKCNAYQFKFVENMSNTNLIVENKKQKQNNHFWDQGFTKW